MSGRGQTILPLSESNEANQMDRPRAFAMTDLRIRLAFVMLYRKMSSEGSVMPGSNRDRVFVSYSHKDKRWLDDLLVHLRPYLRANSVTAWSDRQIQPGSKWFDEIQNELSRARVAVLLVSPTFLASDFIHEHELTPLLRDAEDGGVTILWVPVRSSSYQKSPIKNYQAVIEPKKPLAEMKAERDAAWVRICEEIERAVNPRKPGETTRAKKPPITGEPDERRAAHRWLVRQLERSMASSELQDSLLAPIVHTALVDESNLELRNTYNFDLVRTAVRLGDEYLMRVKRSAGMRDWQRDFAQTAAPILVGLTHSLERSVEAQALIMRLCDNVAAKLRLRLIWPKKPDKFNDCANAIYRACLEATELEDDDVLLQLKQLKTHGPQ